MLIFLCNISPFWIVFANSLIYSLQGWRLQAAEKRSAAGIACPLGHAMEPAIVPTEAEDDDFSSSFKSPDSTKTNQMRFVAILSSEDLVESPETNTKSQIDIIESHERPLFCQVNVTSTETKILPFS